MSYFGGYIRGMSDHSLTLEEMSQHTGIEARTLRSWVGEGLLSPPLKAGRGARYPGANVLRALAVRALKDGHGLSLAEIGRMFMLATEDQIRDWAAGTGPAPAPRGTARAYLSRIQSAPPAVPLPRQRLLDLAPLRAERRDPEPHGPEGSVPRPLRSFAKTFAPQRTGRDEDGLAGIERLILQLERVLDGPAPRRARGTQWTRIPITPDLELSVRGDLSPGERVLFETLADQFRAILSRSSSNE
jgi:DNA-binding transcriptional MerR regulator